MCVFVPARELKQQPQLDDLQHNVKHVSMNVHIWAFIFIHHNYQVDANVRVCISLQSKNMLKSDKPSSSFNFLLLHCLFFL